MAENHTVRFQVLSPIVHGALDAAGTDTVSALRRTPVWDRERRRIVRVPCVSGNALRGRVRRELFRDLFRAIGIDRSVEGFDDAYSVGANGGYLKDFDATVDPARVREIRAACPPLSVLGSAMISWMLPGRVSVGILWPVTDFTVGVGLCSPQDGPPLGEVESEIHHARLPDRTVGDGAKPMPHGAEMLVPGVPLESLVRFAPETPQVEMQAFWHGLSLVDSVGGKLGSGMGRIEREPPKPATDEYLAWRDSPDARTGTLMALFGR